MKRQKNLIFILSLLLAVALVLVACGGDEATQNNRLRSRKNRPKSLRLRNLLKNPRKTWPAMA